MGSATYDGTPYSGAIRALVLERGIVLSGPQPEALPTHDLSQKCGLVVMVRVRDHASGLCTCVWCRGARVSSVCRLTCGALLNTGVGGSVQ